MFVSSIVRHSSGSPARIENAHHLLSDRQRAILVEGAMVAERAKIELQRFRFDEPGIRYVVDDDVSKVRLPGHRTDRGKFRSGKAHQIVYVGLRIGHALQHRVVRVVGQVDAAAKLGQVRDIGCGHAADVDRSAGNHKGVDLQTPLT
jgi:hypothetical protein